DLCNSTSTATRYSATPEGLMNSPKVTNIALLLLVVLLMLHEAISLFWAPGRYSWVPNGEGTTSGFNVLDTQTGNLYSMDVDTKTNIATGSVLAIVRLAKNPGDIRDTSFQTAPTKGQH